MSRVTSSPFQSTLEVIYSNIEPPTDKQNYLWYELDDNSNQIFPYPWRWNTSKSKWQSPLLEYFFNYRNDYDAAVPIGGRNVVIINADWWFFPTNDRPIPTQVMLQTGIGNATNLFNTTSINGFNGDRVVNLNREINASNNTSKTIELRFADAVASPRYVWGNIKLEYILYS